MKKKKIIIILSVVILFSAMWFSDFLPKQVARAVAQNYLSMQESGYTYELGNIDYLAAYNGYFLHYKYKTAGKDKIRKIGVQFHYLPFAVFYDSEYAEG